MQYTLKWFLTAVYVISCIRVQYSVVVVVFLQYIISCALHYIMFYRLIGACQRNIYMKYFGPDILGEGPDLAHRPLFAHHRYRL